MGIYAAPISYRDCHAAYRMIRAPVRAADRSYRYDGPHAPTCIQTRPAPLHYSLPWYRDHWLWQY
jgi:hypothetical protein